MKKHFIYALILSLAISACKKKEETTTEEEVSDSLSNIAQTAMAEANSQANSIVTARLSELELLANEEMETTSNRATCSISAARSTCANNSTTVNWDGCTIGSTTATLTGVITETFSSFGAAVCQLNGNGSKLTRVISSSSPRVLTLESGATITSTMTPDTAWDGTTFPSASTGTTITRVESGTSVNGSQSCSVGSVCYEIVVNGVQNILKGPKGRKWFDHIITSNISAKGSKAAGTMTIYGTSSVWHQLASYKAVNTYNAVVWGTPSCCYPTSGSISTVFTGSIAGTTTLTFGSTCGSATFVDTAGASTSVTLNQCQP